VGVSSDQVINIELPNFGKDGTITNGVTAKATDLKIDTLTGANSAITAIATSLDKVSDTRSLMGAVMNRLEHVIDNLTNVSMNTEASRSRIQDADYAAASTELARTQIMQQAATAVLAQANTSQQTVLKLLQG
jgi:flagellin